MGPMWSPLKLVTSNPRWLTRPKVCLRPTTPQKAPGRRTEPPQVGSQRGEGHAGGHVGAAAAAGPPGDVVNVPGVVHRAVVGVVGGCAGGELLKVLLAR